MYFGENTHQHASRDVGVEGGIARAAQGKAGQEFLCPFGRRAKPAQQFREHASEVGVPILPMMLFPPPPRLFSTKISALSFLLSRGENLRFFE